MLLFHFFDSSESSPQSHGSAWLVGRLKQLCGGHVAGCAYNDY